jgi:hypothetical protein
MTIQKKITGKRPDVKEILELAKAGMSRGMQQSGQQLTGYIKNAMFNGVKTGVIYPVTSGLRKGQNVRASSPTSAENRSNTDFPAVRTGGLVKTINSKTQGSRKLVIGAGNSNIDYAKDLEETRHFLERTAKTNEKRVETNVENQINSALKSKGILVRKV